MNWQRELKKKLRLNFKGDYKFDELLLKHTTFRIGGKCSLWCEPEDLDSLRFILRYKKYKDIRLFVIGEGSNVLVRDGGFRGIVVHLNSPYFRRIEFKERYVFAGSGVKLREIIRSASRKNLGGMEFLAGIPGRLGGALMMNAGVTERFQEQNLKFKSIGDLVESITVMDYNSNIRDLNRDEIKFEYRSSDLSEYIILSAVLKLKKRRREKILKIIKQFLEYRRNTQDLRYPSIGCVFKNPKGESAGRLIEACNLKGKRIGGAQISSKHANFIINMKDAKAKDVLRLMRIIQREGYRKFQISLKPEIRII